MSLPASLSILLLENDVFIDQFTEEKIGSPELLDMVRRVEVTYDPELDAAGGGLMSNQTDVVVLLRDGTELRATGNQRGTRGDPVTLDEIVAKFRKTTRDALDEKDANQIIDMCTHLDELDDVAPLIALLN